jgi:hypothetical protein
MQQERERHDRLTQTWKKRSGERPREVHKNRPQKSYIMVPLADASSDVFVVVAVTWTRCAAARAKTSRTRAVIVDKVRARCRSCWAERRQSVRKGIPQQNTLGPPTCPYNLLFSSPSNTNPQRETRAAPRSRKNCDQSSRWRCGSGVPELLCCFQLFWGRGVRMEPWEGERVGGLFLS